jgi:ParB family chromosome partitioning protein
MASAVQKIKFSPSRDIPFNKLVLSQANVRRVKAGTGGVGVLSKVLERYPVARIVERAERAA